MSVQDILESLPLKNAGGLCELGKIKIGGKSAQVRRSANGNEWRAPEKHDHFTITTMNRDSRGDLIVDQALMDELIALYGDADGKLRQIPIRLLSDDIDDIMQSAFVWYGRKSCGARSDGKKVMWFYHPETMAPYNPPLEEDWGPELLNMQRNGVPLFKPHTNLNCVIASKESRWGGVYKFRTTSMISLRQLHVSLLHLASLTGGILSGMPLMLVLRPMQVSPDGKPSTVYVVHVELRGGDMQQLQNQAMDLAKFRLTFANQIQSTQRQYKKLLALPGTEPEAEASDIAEEFAPEAQEELQTVPTETKFGLLDDDAQTTAAQTTTPGQAEPLPTQKPQQQPDREPTDEIAPSPAATKAETRAVQSPESSSSETISDAEALSIRVSDLCDQEWEPFVAGWYQMVKPQGLAESDFHTCVRKMVIGVGKKGKENQLSKTTRKNWVMASLDGRLNWLSGKISLPADKAPVGAV